jgi:IS30 family transposase
MRRPRTLEQIAAYRQTVRTLYEEGMSLRMISEQVGKTRQAIQQLLVRMGVPRRPRGGNQGSHSRHRR